MLHGTHLFHQINGPQNNSTFCQRPLVGPASERNENNYDQCDLKCFFALKNELINSWHRNEMPLIHAIRSENAGANPLQDSVLMLAFKCHSKGWGKCCDAVYVLLCPRKILVYDYLMFCFHFKTYPIFVSHVEYFWSDALHQTGFYRNT